MREFIRLAVLFSLLGISFVVGGVLMSVMGLATPEINDKQTATLAAGSNALLLMLGFGGASLSYWLLYAREEGIELLRGLGGNFATYSLIALFMGGLFLFLPWLGLDAESFRLPSSLHRWEILLEAQEARIEALMRSLIQYGALPSLIIFMAVAPGIFEELFFRGALQHQLGRIINPHGAVWISAIIFSLIHFQVYGFVPRALLGAVMGYLTLWSGRLWPAIWAHFLNNAYATLVAYLGMHVWNHPEWLESTYKPPMLLALLGALIAGASGYAVYRRLHA
ncbi:MAG: CPBP family intramembrane glutamic endopeptidase [Bacteroidia bacterium]|nr:CPBP family intramembrane metalloprotease [Bacteroidia bacterium]MDW8134819.1 CPBP family intramembrane glutamic endopeptidase [Bacteroidia bacterium]